jgi:NADPH-dependent 2,4-dienoyl-CoA reductase/sulfur reductase-like enzyme
MLLFHFSFVMTAIFFGITLHANETIDVCVYGGTPSGLVAAVAAKQEGMNVLLIESSRWLGGIIVSIIISPLAGRIKFNEFVNGYK